MEHYYQSQKFAGVVGAEALVESIINAPSPEEVGAVGGVYVWCCWWFVCLVLLVVVYVWWCGGGVCNVYDGAAF